MPREGVNVAFLNLRLDERGYTSVAVPVRTVAPPVAKLAMSAAAAWPSELAIPAPSASPDSKSSVAIRY
jgi:hypothetical protein